MGIKRNYKVRGYEIDPLYLLKPYHLISYFQDCFAIYCTDRGAATFQQIMEGKTWVMKELMINFSEHMPRWDEEVTVEVMIRSIKGVKIDVDFSCSYKNKVIAQGTSRWIIINEENRRPLRVDFLNEILECIQPGLFKGYNFSKLLPETDYTWGYEDIVRSFDIDFNAHLHGIKYIESALECIPATFKAGKTLSKLEISYLKELNLNNKLRSLSVEREEHVIHELRHCDSDTEISSFLMRSHWL